MKWVLVGIGALLLVVGVVVAVVGPTTLKRLAYEEPGRDRWQQPERVVESLGLKPGSSVADIGSGGGYFAFRLAEAVGAAGSVYAVDLDEGLNRYVTEEARKRGLGQLRVVKAEPDDPRIPTPVDLIFMSNTLHHFKEPEVYVANAQRYLRSDGRLAVVDYYDSHRALPADELEARLESVGYELVESFSFLEKQYFLVFRVSG